MLPLVLVAQIAAADPAAAPSSPYATPALQAFIADAARENAAPPRTLRRYTSHVESELSLIARDTAGREHIAQTEQIALRATWQRGQRYDLRIVGYRSQTVGVPYSTLSFARSWTLPHLYGERLTLGLDLGSSAAQERRSDSAAPSGSGHARARTGVRAVHPLAADRERYYTYRGGDTIATLHSAGRAIPIVRVDVVPRFDSLSGQERLGAFEGELDFDATRHQIVRLRGRFFAVAADRTRKRTLLARLAGVSVVAYAEFVNAEVDGAYWLPATQRAELQGTISLFGPSRSVFRVTSHFGHIAVDRSSVDQAAHDSSDELRVQEGRRLTYAPPDSISAFSRWEFPLGEATAAVTAADFDDLAPDAWSATGPPRVDFLPSKPEELFRFNRVEGAFVGVAGRMRLRDRAPGLTMRAFGGWAFTERTLRGGAGISLERRRISTYVRAERSLASTNDFVSPMEGSTGIGTLLGGNDDYDYADRRIAAAGAIMGGDWARLTGEIAAASDRSEVARLAFGPLARTTRFRPNRGIVPGRYVRVSTALELNPGVTGVFLEPGIGARFSYEAADGVVRWQRGEAELAARVGRGDVMLLGRIEGGAVSGNELPPQQLFELGGEGALPGYGYKEFGGDRAATGGALAIYSFPLLRRPWRMVRSLMVPGLSPGLATGVQGGWSEVSSAAARAAIARLDPLAPANCVDLPTAGCPKPLSRPTDGIRATIDVRVTLFGGLVGIGAARPVDHADRWRLVFRAGQQF